MEVQDRSDLSRCHWPTHGCSSGQAEVGRDVEALTTVFLAGRVFLEELATAAASHTNLPADKHIFGNKDQATTGNYRRF